jgi:hypothetical protein
MTRVVCSTNIHVFSPGHNTCRCGRAMRSGDDKAQIVAVDPVLTDEETE